MPHDKFGRLVEKGDVVTVLFKVKEIFQSEEFYNTCLESVDALPGNDSKIQLSAVNTRQTVLYEKFDGEPVSALSQQELGSAGVT